MYGDYDYMRAWQRAEQNGTSLADEWDRSWIPGVDFDPSDPDEMEIMRDVFERDAETGKDLEIKLLRRRNTTLSERLQETDPEFDPDEY